MEPSVPRPVKRSSWKRRLAIAVGVMVLLLATVAILLPWLLKHYVEQHSEEWIGRKVSIGNIILNPFTFTYAVNGFTCHEPKSDAVFVSWKTISMKADLWRGFREGNWRFRRLRIQDPYVHIVQKGDRFNFSDLLELGSDSAEADKADTSATRFSMEDILISGGRIAYGSNILKSPVELTDLRAACSRITSASSRMDFSVGLRIGGGGDLSGDFTIDTEQERYAVRAQLKQFALPQLLPYLQDFMRTTALKGLLDVKLDLQDSWADTTALTLSGALDLHGLGVTDAHGEPLIDLASGSVVLDTLNARETRFKLSRLMMDGFSTRFQQWADGSNTWTKALKLDSTSSGDSTAVTLAAAPDNIFVMLADYIRMLGQDFVGNQYTADSMSILNGTVAFEDFTPEKPFRFTIDSVDLRTSRITTASSTADLFASARLNGQGRVHSTFRFDPRDFRNMDATMEVKDLDLRGLDAYSRWYAAFPIRSGTLDYAGSTRIHDGVIDSRNALHAADLRFGKKVSLHDTGIYVLPLRLASSLLKDVHGMIDLDVPVQGDLKDPTFKVWPVVWQVLKNLVVKAAAAPVRLVVGALGSDADEDLEEVRFLPVQTTLGKEQRRALDALADLLRTKPGLAVDLVPVTDVQQEREAWAAVRLKREYLGLAGALSAADSAKVAALSLRDPGMMAYLDQRSPGTKGNAERSRCMAILGADPVAHAVDAAELARRAAVQNYLLKAGCDGGRIRFRAGNPEETAGHLGEPGFRFIVGVDDRADP